LGIAAADFSQDECHSTNSAKLLKKNTSSNIYVY